MLLLTIRLQTRLVKVMRFSDKMIQKLVGKMFHEIKEHNLIEFKEKEGQVMGRAVELIKADFLRERELDNEVNSMMDELERNNSGEFQRYKMFPLLKKRLAKEKGIVL